MARVLSVVQNQPPGQAALRPSGLTVRKLAVTSRVCGGCGSTDIRPSYRRNALDILLACLFLAPFRCRTCNGRFYRVWRPGLMNPPEPSSAPLLVIPLRRDPPVLRPEEPDPIETPVVEPDPPQEKPAEIHPPPLQPLVAAVPSAIFILESDLSIRKLLRRLLERRGYLIEEIEQADHLAGKLHDHRAAMLIVDTSTMKGSAVEALVALARAHSSLKILALSTDSLEGHEIPGRLLALPKPFPLDRFVECVDRLLERSTATTAGR
jgi:CheY-like chemotaxis protein